MQSPKNAAAGFGTRWVAYIIDCLLSGLVSGMVGVPLIIGSLFSEDSIWTTRVLFDFTLYAVVMYCIRSLYFVILTYAFGKTLGKMLLRIEVQSKEGEKLTFINVLFRETIGRFLSGFILYGGYLIALEGKEHLTLHDRLCDTRVCYTDLTEMEKKAPVNMQTAQPIPHIAAGKPTTPPFPKEGGVSITSQVSRQDTDSTASFVSSENCVSQDTDKREEAQVWTLPQQEEAFDTKESADVVLEPSRQEEIPSENNNEEQV